MRDAVFVSGRGCCANEAFDRRGTAVSSSFNLYLCSEQCVMKNLAVVAIVFGLAASAAWAGLLVFESLRVIGLL